MCAPIVANQYVIIHILTPTEIVFEIYFSISVPEKLLLSLRSDASIVLMFGCTSLFALVTRNCLAKSEALSDHLEQFL